LVKLTVSYEYALFPSCFVEKEKIQVTLQMGPKNLQNHRPVTVQRINRGPGFHFKSNEIKRVRFFTMKIWPLPHCCHSIGPKSSLSIGIWIIFPPFLSFAGLTFLTFFSFFFLEHILVTND